MRNDGDGLPMNGQDDAKVVNVCSNHRPCLPSKRGQTFSILWVLLVSSSPMMTPPDVSYSNPGHDALHEGQDAHRCSAMVVESYIPFFHLGDSALCVVLDAHHYSVVVVQGQPHCYRSGRNALYSMPDAHRCSAVQCCP